MIQTQLAGLTAGTPYFGQIQCVDLDEASSTSSVFEMSPTNAVDCNDAQCSLQWGLQQIKAFTAWSTTQGSDAVTIAVIDTGVEYAHEDLNDGRVNVNADQDYANNDDDAVDDQGHGTHVAGIAGADTNNALGVAGVCPNCTILPLKSLDAAGAGSNENVAKAIRYAADQNANIINMSLGGSCSQEIAEAVNYAYERDVTMIASAGNSCAAEVALGLASFDVKYPAAFERVIAVGASNQSDARADFSHYGPELDVMAPGVEILSTYLGNTYKELDGTSMAAPYVTGTAGLILSQDSSLSPAQVQSLLESSAQDIDAAGRDDLTGWGRINAQRALQTAPQNVSAAPVAVCPETQETSTGTSAEDLLSLYRRLRNDVFLTTRLGTSFTNLYYEHSPQLASILLADEDLNRRVAQFLQNSSDEFEALLPDSTSGITLSQELISEADALVNDIKAQASLDFQKDISEIWDTLALGQRAEEEPEAIWREINANDVYLPAIVR